MTSFSIHIDANATDASRKEAVLEHLERVNPQGPEETREALQAISGLGGEDRQAYARLFLSNQQMDEKEMN